MWVSLAFTVLRMDAGRIVSQKQPRVGEDETRAVALGKLFDLGGSMLVESLPQLLGGAAFAEAAEQDEEAVTHAPKLSKEEGILEPLAMTARECHDTACALNVWPGTSLKLVCTTPVAPKKKTAGEEDTKALGEAEVKESRLVMKVSETAVESSAEAWDTEKMPLLVGNVQMCKGRKATDMLVVCKGNTLLRVGTIQLPGKKPTNPKSFYNGRKGSALTCEGEPPLNVEFNPEILSKIAKADIGRGINSN